MKDYYKIKEISRFYGIGPDSLRYYEELGILSPQRGTNGYRLYGMREIYRLNVIKDLRQLGFSMQNIKEYLEHKNLASTLDLLDNGARRVEEKIRRLQAVAQSLHSRAEEMRAYAATDTGEIALCEFPERNCLQLDVDTTRDEEVDFALNKLNEKFEHRLYLINSYMIGATQSLEALRGGAYGRFRSVFYIIPEGEYDFDFTIPQGRYLSLHCRGDYARIEPQVQRLLRYAEDEGLTLTGDLLELYKIDIHETNDRSEFLTEVQIQVV